MAGLFALGSNGSGQLGLGHKEDVSVPKQVTFHSLPASNPTVSDPVVQVAAGGNHTVILTSSGQAFWSGDSSSGACGLTTISTAANAQFERLVLSETPGLLGTVVRVACTWDSSTFVLRDQDGKATCLYSCGNSTHGQLGFEASGIAEPTRIPGFPPPGTEVVDLAAGLAHVVAVLNNGEVYGWGNGRKGQLGQAAVLGDGTPPVPVVYCAPCRIGGSSGVDFPVAKVVCGQYHTCLIGEATGGRILVLGPDKWNLLSNAPKTLPGWRTINGSWGGVYALKDDGSLVAWGRDDHGQLPPPGLPKLKDVVAGSEHVLALTDEDEVLAWGWGEHGNCGPGTDGASGDIRGRWNVIASSRNLSDGSKITAIGAGCATSWVYVNANGIHI